MTKVLFLDRDGVINRFPGKSSYVTKLSQFHLFSYTPKAIREFSRAGFRVYVVSNQGCIAKKLISQTELLKITAFMRSRVREAGGKINGVFYCPHEEKDRCACKKPKTALFRKAIGTKRVDLKETFFIGDSIEDVLAAKNLGCQSILVLSGRTKRRDLKKWPLRPDIVKKNLWEASQWITRKK